MSDQAQNPASETPAALEGVPEAMIALVGLFGSIAAHGAVKYAGAEEMTARGLLDERGVPTQKLSQEVQALAIKGAELAIPLMVALVNEAQAELKALFRAAIAKPANTLHIPTLN